MLSVVAVILLSGAVQAEPDLLFEKLSDNRLEVREEAVAELARLFLEFEKAIRARAKSTPDAEERSRLQQVIYLGVRLSARRRLEGLIPERITRRYPRWISDLFSPNESRAAGALRAVAQASFGPVSRHPIYSDLYLTASEFRKVVPHLFVILDRPVNALPIVQAWFEVVERRKEVLEIPGGIEASRRLFTHREVAARNHAIKAGFKQVGVDKDVKPVSRFWSEMDEMTRLSFLRAIAKHDLRSGYPFLLEKLDDPAHGDFVADLIDHHQLVKLMPRLLEEIEKGKFGGVDRLAKIGGKKATELLVAKLGKEGEDPAKIINLLRAQSTAGLGDRVAPYLESPRWAVREAALRYLKDYGTAKHAGAVGRSLRDYWNKTTPDDGNRNRFSASSIPELLAEWKAHEEIERLIPLMDGESRGYTIARMVTRTRSPGAAAKVGALLESESQKIAIQALWLLGELKAADEARRRLNTIQEVLRKLDDEGWERNGYGLVTSLRKLALPEIAPILVQWARNPKRRGYALQALSTSWTDINRGSALEDPDPIVRMIGLRLLTKEDARKRWEIVRRLTDDVSLEVRQAAAATLRKVDTDDSRAIALKLSWSKDPVVAYQATWAYVGRIGGLDYEVSMEHSTPTKPALALKLLKHPVPLMRQHALARVHPQAIMNDPSILAPLLADQSEEVRRNAWSLRERTLGRTDPEAYAKEFFAKMTDPARLTNDLDRIARNVRPEVMAPMLLKLVQEIDSGRRKVRTESYPMGLGKIDYNASTVLEKAASLLGSYRSLDSEPVLLKLATSGDSKVRSGAIKGLGLLGSRKGLPAYFKAIGTREGYAAAEAIGRTGSVPDELLKGNDVTRLSHGLWAVKIARDRGHWDRTVELSHHRSRPVGKAAIAALGAMARPEDATALFELSYVPDFILRQYFLKELARFPSAALERGIVDFLDEDPNVAVMAARLIRLHRIKGHGRVLLSNLKGHIYWARAELIRAVGASGPPDCAAEVYTWTLPGEDAGDVNVAAAAIEALAELGATQYADGVLERVKSYPKNRRDLVIPGVAKLAGKASIPFLVEELGSSDRGTRSIAARTLAELRATDFEAQFTNILLESWRGRLGYDDLDALIRCGAVAWVPRVFEKGGDDKELAAMARLGNSQAKKLLVEKLGRPPYESLATIEALNLVHHPGLRKETLSLRRGRVPVTVSRALSELSRVFGLEIDSKGISKARAASAVVSLKKGPAFTPASVLHEISRHPRLQVAWAVDENGKITIRGFKTIRRLWIDRLSN